MDDLVKVVVYDNIVLIDVVGVIDDICCGKDNRYVGIDELMNG